MRCSTISTRVDAAFTPNLIHAFQGKLYTALNPIYAGEPLSGRGAEIYGGRFNARGVAALYTSLTIKTALKEANQVAICRPTTWVCYDAILKAVFDCRASANANIRRSSPRGLLRTDDQEFSTRGKSDDLNLVLVDLGYGGTCSLVVIDDEHRLSRLFWVICPSCGRAGRLVARFPRVCNRHTQVAT